MFRKRKGKNRGREIDRAGMEDLRWAREHRTQMQKILLTGSIKINGYVNSPPSLFA